MGDDYKKILKIIKKGIDKKMINDLSLLEGEREKREALNKAVAIFIQRLLDDMKKEVKILEGKGTDTYHLNIKILFMENKFNSLLRNITHNELSRLLDVVKQFRKEVKNEII